MSGLFISLSAIVELGLVELEKDIAKKERELEPDSSGEVETLIIYYT